MINAAGLALVPTTRAAGQFEMIEVDCRDNRLQEELLRDKAFVHARARSSRSSEVNGRRELFRHIAKQSQALIISEGLVFIWAEEVGFTRITRRTNSFAAGCWISSRPRWPNAAKENGKAGRNRRRLSCHKDPEFFRKFGWKPASVRSCGTLLVSETPAEADEFLLPLQKSEAFQAKQPWGGVFIEQKVKTGSFQEFRVQTLVCLLRKKQAKAWALNT